MSDVPVGMQLIIYRERWQHDLPGVLAEVSAAGYTGVETRCLAGMYELDDVKSWLAENNLACTGLHGGYATYTDPDQRAQSITWAQALGAKHLLCSGVAKGEGITPYEESAEVFNEVGRICRDEGLVFCYHNHWWEFEEFDGVRGIHRLVELTDPDVVKLNIDTLWVHVGGENPAEFIRRYANRAGYFHFKDGAPPKHFTELGSGEVDLAACLEAAREVGIDWIVYEQDRSEKEPRLSIMESRVYLRKLGV